MSELRMVAVDGQDALAYVIIRPGPTPRTVMPEAAAHGISKKAAAWVLRQLADMWEAEAAEEEREAK